MRFKSKDDLSKRVSKAIEILSKDERYPESLASLKDAEYEMDINGFEEAKRLLSDTLHDDDKTHPLHQEVARLLMDIYLDGVEERDPDYICVNSVHFTIQEEPESRIMKGQPNIIFWLKKAETNRQPKISDTSTTMEEPVKRTI